MIRIRTGTSWRTDPRLAAALRRASGRARAVAARGVVDALAIEVDGVDLTGGRAEGALLPSLEALLRAVARVLGGAPHAAVPFPDASLELLIRRRGPSALLTVVALSRPSRVLAADVEVELETLAAAALEGAAEFCRELAEAVPGAERESSRLRAAARDLRRTEAGPATRARPPGRSRPPRPAPRPGRPACLVEVADEEGLLAAYEGGRPDLGSLLAAGRVELRATDGAPLCELARYPFLALRDLAAAAERIVSAVRAGERRLRVSLARRGRAGELALDLDLDLGTAGVPGGAASPCPPLELAAAISGGALELGRIARARNPRQAENALLADLEAAAAERIGEIEELLGGDVAGGAPPASARGPAGARVPQRPLGPGRLRHLAFRRVFELDVGAPAGAGLRAAGGLLHATGADAVLAIDRAGGEIAWRAEGCGFAAALPGAVLAARGRTLAAHAPRSGRVLWSRPLPGGGLTSAVALARGPYVLAERGALTAVDPGSGRTLWRLEPPGASRLEPAAFGGILVAAADTGFVYGVDAAGRLAWRVRADGPVAGAPVAAAGACLVCSAGDARAALLAIDPASGARRFETPLDLVPSTAPVAWGSRVAVAGTLGGEPIVTVLERGGAARWTVSPPLAGAVGLVAAGPLLVARDGGGALVALAPDGTARWSRPAPGGHLPPAAATPALARGTLLVAADGLTCLDARTGELVGAIPRVAPVRLAVDAALAVAALDADGLVTGLRLATHLSVV